MRRPRSTEEFVSYYQRDEIASRYDEQRSRTLKQQIVRAIEKDFFCRQLPASGRVLEIGIGTGAIAAAVCRRLPLVGIDTSPAMLLQAQQRLAGEQVRLVELSMFDIATLNERFAMIYASRVFLHLDRKDLVAMLTLCAERLEPGGLLAFDLQRPNLFKATLDLLEPKKMFNFRYSRAAIAAVLGDEPRLRLREVVAFEHMIPLAIAALLPNRPLLAPLGERLRRFDTHCAKFSWSANRWGIVCERI